MADEQRLATGSEAVRKFLYDRGCIFTKDFPREIARAALAAVDALETSPRAEYEAEAEDFGLALHIAMTILISLGYDEKPGKYKAQLDNITPRYSRYVDFIAALYKRRAEVVESSPLTPKDGK